MKISSVCATILAVVFSLSLAGCGLVGSLRSNTDLSSSVEENLPAWLTVAHRAQAASQPEKDFEETSRDDSTVTVPAITQPVSRQPDSTQPIQQVEQSTLTSGKPRWQQPGTMEYIAKQQLDQLAFNYKRLNTRITDFDGEEVNLKNLEKDRTDLYEVMLEVANGIGLSLDKEYGIKPPPAETEETKTDKGWFHSWEQSPSGFGN